MLISNNGQTISGNGNTLYGPNSNWGAYLLVGGNGWAGSSNTASIVTTNGNLHLDAAGAGAGAGSGMYLNNYSGSFVCMGPGGNWANISAIGAGFATQVTSPMFNGLCSTSLGSNQTWQDMTASRAVGTTYTNTTGKPIMIIVEAGYGAPSICWINLIVNTLPVFTIAYGTNSGGGNEAVGSAIIPNGSTYSITVYGSMQSWHELR